jgi:hypothetical protein
MAKPYAATNNCQCFANDHLNRFFVSGLNCLFQVHDREVMNEVVDNWNDVFHKIGVKCIQEDGVLMGFSLLFITLPQDGPKQ